MDGWANAVFLHKIVYAKHAFSIAAMHAKSREDDGLREKAVEAERAGASGVYEPTGEGGEHPAHKVFDERIGEKGALVHRVGANEGMV